MPEASTAQVVIVGLALLFVAAALAHLVRKYHDHQMAAAKAPAVPTPRDLLVQQLADTEAEVLDNTTKAETGEWHVQAYLTRIAMLEKRAARIRLALEAGTVPRNAAVPVAPMPESFAVALSEQSEVHRQQGEGHETQAAR